MNTSSFKERFNRWKNGELVYKAGLPVETYDDGKNAEDPSLRAAWEYALSIKLDEYNDGKNAVAGNYNFNAINQIPEEAPLSYGSYYDLTGDYKMDNRLPKYAGGKVPFDDNIAIDYIGQLENANRVGFKDGVWRTPKIKGYDPYQIGMGLDTREEHNPIVYNYLKSKGRLNDPWLTEKEERDLRMKTWNSKKGAMNRFVEKYGDSIDLMGYNRAAGMLWHGHPFKRMNDPTSITGKGLADSIANGDKSLSGAFNAYYGYKGNAVRFKDRVRRDAEYVKNHSTPVLNLKMLSKNKGEQILRQAVQKEQQKAFVQESTKIPSLPRIEEVAPSFTPYIGRDWSQKRRNVRSIIDAVNLIRQWNNYWNDYQPPIFQPVK